ncbi:histidine phosphatase family protein [Ideonella sp. DXS29W]|uniref:Histidine phosphatase family protein n=1 Tax=Ideonella lacteola TaxID=2984193 RepID=A0ABU9BVT0_9BURK
MRTSVYLIRHGAYDHRPSPEGTEASCDFGLSELGRRQAYALADRLVSTGEIRSDALFCSTLPRARQTADILAPALGLAAVPLPELCEWESGNEVLGVDAFMRKFDELDLSQRRTHRFCDGFETIQEFTVRVQSKLRELLSRFEGKTIVLVVHGGVVEAAFSYFLGFGPGPFEGGYPAAGHTSITHWRQSTTRREWVQEFANDTHHLRGLA